MASDIQEEKPLPAVPSKAGWAPGSVTIPPSFRCLAANAAAIAEVHTLCFHIASAFLINAT